MHYNNSTAQHAVLYYKGMYQSMRDLNIILSETIHFGNDTISFFRLLLPPPHPPPPPRYIPIAPLQVRVYIT